MKSIGRVILLIVGGMTIITAFKDFSAFLDGIKNIQGCSGFIDFIKKLGDATFREQNLQFLTTGLKALGMLILSALAILAGAFGRCGFWFSIGSLVLLGFFVYDIYGKYKAGMFKGDAQQIIQTVTQLLTDSIVQVGFIAGFLLVKLGKGEKAK